MRYHCGMRFLKPARGMSLVDVVVGTALMLVIFTALFGLLRASALVSSLAKSKAGATAMAESQMEYLRGLSYDSLGTAGGIPSGAIAQVATTTVSGSTYVVHTFVQYVDDPAEGVRNVVGALRSSGTLSLLAASRNGAVLARALAGYFADAQRGLSDPGRQQRDQNDTHECAKGGRTESSRKCRARPAVASHRISVECRRHRPGFARNIEQDGRDGAAEQSAPVDA